MLTQTHVTTIVPVVDIGRARRFYEEKLGIQRGESTSDGGVLYRTGGGDFQLSPRKEAPHNPYTLMSFEVPDVTREVKDLEASGVAFEDYDLPDLRTVDHVCTLGSEKAAWFKDPDGNVLCLHEHVARSPERSSRS